MAIGQEVETIEPEVESSEDVVYIQDLSTRLLGEVDFFLQDRPSVPLNLGDLKEKLERYNAGGFQMKDVDFTCLERAVSFVADRLGRPGFEEDKQRLSEILANIKLGSISFVNGLADDSLNQFAGLDANVQLLRRPQNVADNEENMRLLHRKLLPYSVYFGKHGSSLAEAVRAESSEDAVAEYNNLVEEYNLAVESGQVDLDQVSGILQRAYALFDKKSDNLGTNGQN